MVVLAVLALVIGPQVSTLPISDYFSQPAVYRYSAFGALMSLQYELPGVFDGLAFKSVNGSLWSIPYEVFANIVLGCVALLGAFASRAVATSLFVLILVDAAAGNRVLFTWLPRIRK